MEYEYIHGTITRIKRDFPYPFHRQSGIVWECKIKVAFEEQEDDGDVEEYVYKAYPTGGDPNKWCSLKRGTNVVMKVRPRPNSHLRGEIIELTVVE